MKYAKTETKSNIGSVKYQVIEYDELDRAKYFYHSTDDDGIEVWRNNEWYDPIDESLWDSTDYSNILLDAKIHLNNYTFLPEIHFSGILSMEDFTEYFIKQNEQEEFIKRFSAELVSCGVLNTMIKCRNRYE